jgi:hypothetical protein
MKIQNHSPLNFNRLFLLLKNFIELNEFNIFQRDAPCYSTSQVKLLMIRR